MWWLHLVARRSRSFAISSTLVPLLLRKHNRPAGCNAATFESPNTAHLELRELGCSARMAWKPRCTQRIGALVLWQFSLSTGVDARPELSSVFINLGVSSVDDTLGEEHRCRLVQDKAHSFYKDQWPLYSSIEWLVSHLLFLTCHSSSISAVVIRTSFPIMFVLMDD